jgi:hypothetical protein
VICRAPSGIEAFDEVNLKLTVQLRLVEDLDQGAAAMAGDERQRISSGPRRSQVCQVKRRSIWPKAQDH